MAPKAPTPRTTRNSRGLRSSPAVSSVPAVPSTVTRRTSTRRTAATTTVSAPVAPATPTPRPRATNFSSAAPPLHQIKEEATTTATPVTVRRRIFPPPVALPPATPTTTAATLQHPRVSSIRGTPRQQSPRTPIYHPQRYLVRWVDRTPQPVVPSTPDSPGHETTRFRARRDQEDEEEFARELYIAIRNDHLMRDCWCGPPIIYNSLEEAEEGGGHFRFYTTGPDSKNLRVIQKKDDSRWHCICGQKVHPVYNDLLNSNGKRPATDSELDLIAQNEGLQTAQSVEKVLPAKPQQEQIGVQPQLRSMWDRARGLASSLVATMSSPFHNILGKIRDAYEAVETRSWSAQDDTIVVKRVKRQTQQKIIPGEQSHDENDPEFAKLAWAAVPTKRIGYFKLKEFKNSLNDQIAIVGAGRIVSGASTIEEIKAQIDAGYDEATSIAVLKYQELMFGPVSPQLPEPERAEQLLTAFYKFQHTLHQAHGFINQLYNPAHFEDIKKAHNTPPRKLVLGDYVFRKHARETAEFMCFLSSLKEFLPMSRDTLETLSNICVDANAVHKQETVPSFVEIRTEGPYADMPGYFPEDDDAVMEPVHLEDMRIEPFYEFRYPSPELSDSDEDLPKNPGLYRKIAKPKGILKPSKKWDAPPSPKPYCPTPQKKRILAFESPVSRFIPPSHIPARVMTPSEAEQLLQAERKAKILRDKYSTRIFETSKTVSRSNLLFADSDNQWSLDGLEKEDEELGLKYHSQKYGDFLNDVKEDLDEREENKKRKKDELDKREAVLKRDKVLIPAPRRLRTPERKRRELARVAELNDTIASPAHPSPYTNPFRQQKDAEQQESRKETKPKMSAFDRLFDDDEVERMLMISTQKVQELELNKQIEDEFQAALKRDAEEKRQRELEEAARAERRRLEEERRNREEERKRREAEARSRREEQLRKQTEEFLALTGLRRPNRPLIEEMSHDWHEKVANISMTNPTVPLAKTPEGQDLIRRDFEEMLLPPTAWLNDNIIIGSILHVADAINTYKNAPATEPKCAAFTSFFYPRLVSHGAKNCARLLRRANVRKNNFYDIETILVPICEHSHWTLAIVRPGQKTVAHIDSLRSGRGRKEVTDKMFELVSTVLEDDYNEQEWRAVDYMAPRQDNGWDCGVFTITNALCIALGVDPNQSYSAGQLTEQRRRLAAVLLNGGFKGDFGIEGY
ncbi:ubiquitin-like-specific protease 1 [Podospora fimiseda]|uniref:Ubiquitin-like-specific protease 1 n=1 Tax=Podospora fimiseda TaxID=252190 RepID=A0AAN7BP97_9PEZI|nr:ubiquitin-like-specific protease 1 [Podospora fimiseda]